MLEVDANSILRSVFEKIVIDVSAIKVLNCIFCVSIKPMDSTHWETRIEVEMWFTLCLNKWMEWRWLIKFLHGFRKSFLMGSIVNTVSISAFK